MKTRKYTKNKRAEQEEETRQRIVEATMALHETLGAARTTVSAVAREAGVQRLTVYRHFPDEADLLVACTSRWLEQHPLPDPSGWAGVAEPIARTQHALAAFYAYYRATRTMWTSSYRDRGLVPALAERMALVEAYLDGQAAELTAGLAEGDDAARLRAYATVRHALRFGTWQSLADVGLDDGQAAALAVRWLAGGALRVPGEAV